MCVCAHACVSLCIKNITFLIRHHWLRNILDKHLQQTIWAGREGEQHTTGLLRNLKLAVDFTQKAIA